MMAQMVLSPALRKGLGADGGLGQRLVAAIPKPECVVQRTAVIDGERRIRVRAQFDAGVEYFDLVVAQVGPHTVRAIDHESLSTGTTFSAAITELVVPILRAQHRGVWERVTAGPNPWAGMEKAGLMRELIEKGEFNQAHQVLTSLPQAFRESRSGLLAAIRIGRGQGETEYLAALQRMEQRYPGDASLSMLLIDAYSLRKEWDKADAQITTLETVVGIDAAILGMRANIALQRQDLSAAARWATASTDREPGSKKAWFTALGVALSSNDHPRTVVYLDEIAERFSVAWKDLTTIPEYAAFCASTNYVAWKKRKNLAPTSPSP